MEVPEGQVNSKLAGRKCKFCNCQSYTKVICNSKLNLEGEEVSSVVVAITQVDNNSEDNQQLGLSKKKKIIEAIPMVYLAGEKTADQIVED